MMRQLALLHSLLALIVLGAGAAPATLAGDPSVCCCCSDAVWLFDGETMNGWVTGEGRPVTDGWEAAGGVLHAVAHGSSIYSDREYGDFELTFDWKIGEGGNSGVKYRVKQYGKAWLGLEYQLLDDGKYDPVQRPKGSLGSLYDLFPPDPRQKHLRPAGQFNHSRIVVCGARIEHWLNGRKLLEADTSGPSWRQAVAASKFHDRENFGLNKFGRIMLQNHGSEAWFRNITLRPLEPCWPACEVPVYAGCEPFCGVGAAPCRLPRLRALLRSRACGGWTFRPFRCW